MLFLFHILCLKLKNKNDYCYFRKKLLETVEFIKKCVALPPQIPQSSKTPTVQCQNEVITIVEETEKHKILNNLPKVGVCTFLVSSFIQNIKYFRIYYCLYICK